MPRTLEQSTITMGKKEYTNIIKTLSAFCFLLFSLHSIFAQQNESVSAASIDILPQESKHSVHVELLGRAFLFGSVNYEYALPKNFAVGAALGITNVQRGTITRDNAGTPEEGRYFDSATSQMVYGNYFVGKRKHKGLVTAGLTHFLITSRNKYPSRTERSLESHFEWNAGLGYQFSANRTYYRLTGYVLSLPEPSGWFPAIMPWGGLTIGCRL